MAPRKKAATPQAPNPLLEAFQDYAVNMARFTEAREAAFAAQRALQESADRLATFGIYVSTAPRPNSEPALPDDGGQEPGDVPPVMHAPAPTIERAPVATEVAAIRNAAYEESEQADAENLAASAGSAMERLMGGLKGAITAAPVVGHPVREKLPDPAQENRGGGPVEQKPVS